MGSTAPVSGPSERACSRAAPETSGLAGEEVLGQEGAGQLLTQKAGQEQQRAAWPIVRRDVLCPPGGVAGDQVEAADGSPRTWAM